MASEKSDSAEPAAATTAAKSNQLYVFFGHESSSVLYSMYEIPVPNPLPPPPTKSAQISEMQNPSPLPNTTPNPILKLKRGEYPRGMCCVQLGSKFYFFGGEYDDLDHAYVAKDVKTKYKNVKRDRYPRDVYVFDPTNTNTNTTTTIDDNKKKSMMISGTPMQTGKAKPLGFVVDEKIYVVGSTFTSKVLKNVDEKNSDIKKHVLFEVYDPVVDKWSTLPTPSHPLIRDSEPEETEWVGHAVVGRKVLLHNQSGYGVLQHRLYCYDLDRGEWINYENLPSYSGNFLGRSEFVGDTLYGVYNGKVSAIAQLADADEEEEEEEEENMGADAENPLYFPSEDLCSVVDAIYHEYPPKQDSSITSSTLLHLGNGVFCFVMSGRTLHRHGYYAIEDNKKGVISIVIFQALGDKHLRGEGEDEDEYEYSSDEDEDEGNAGFFRAKFLYSAHYHINIRSRNLGDIHGCFTLGLSFNFGDECDPNCAEHGKGPMFEPFKEVKKELDLVPTVPQLSLARQKYSDDCEAAVNEQINVEYNVSYVYHAMFAYFDRDNVALKGIAKFFKESSEEERDHAEKFMEYQNKRGGRVRLQSIVMPLSEFDHAEKGDALYAMELALSLEKLKNEKLLNLHSLADRNNDVQLADFVKSKFLTEQVEAIKKISEYVAQLRRVGKGHGTWHFDQMLLDEA